MSITFLYLVSLLFRPVPFLLLFSFLMFFLLFLSLFNSHSAKGCSIYCMPCLQNFFHKRPRISQHLLFILSSLPVHACVTVFWVKTQHTDDSVKKSSLRRATTPSYLIECMITVIIQTCLCQIHTQQKISEVFGVITAGEERLPVQRERTV